MNVSGAIFFPLEPKKQRNRKKNNAWSQVRQEHKTNPQERLRAEATNSHAARENSPRLVAPA